MTKEELIKKLEEIFSTKIISYITSDKKNGPGASIATDALDLFPRHLDSIGEVDSISLFIYSRGGDVDVPWRLVNMIREYCKKFNVIIPYRAHSAATMICLGANKILMGKMSELSPIDPSVSNAFNPDDPKNPINKIPISVEDVTSFVELVKKEIDAETDKDINKSDIICNIFQQLTNKIHPLALGNVQRSHKQIRFLSKILLELHLKHSNEEDNHKIEFIVDTLTEKLYSHMHLISRYEAKNIIGLKVDYLNNDEENLVKQLYEIYKTELSIGSYFNPIELLGQNNNVALSLDIALIETLETSDIFSLQGDISKAPGPDTKPNVKILNQGWNAIK